MSQTRRIPSDAPVAISDPSGLSAIDFGDPVCACGTVFVILSVAASSQINVASPPPPKPPTARIVEPSGVKPMSPSLSTPKTDVSRLVVVTGSHVVVDRISTSPVVK